MVATLADLELFKISHRVFLGKTIVTQIWSGHFLPSLRVLSF